MTKLNELLTKGIEIKQDFQTQLAKALKDEGAKELAKLSSTIEFKHGDAFYRKYSHDQVKAKLAREVMQIVTTKQKEYKALADEAIELAKQTKASAIKKPNDVDFTIFEREYNDLKIASQLGKPEAAVDALSAFVSKWGDQDVYYADHIAQNFGDFTAIQADGKAKLKLSQTYELVKQKAMTDEIAAANQALDFFSDADNVQLVSRAKPAFKSIQASVGPIAQHINTPEKALGIMDGTVKTFGGMQGTNVVE